MAGFQVHSAQSYSPACRLAARRTLPIREDFSRETFARPRLLRRVSVLSCACWLAMSAACGPLIEESQGHIEEDCQSLWPSKGDVTAVCWWEVPQSGANCEEVGGEACAVEELQSTYNECTGGTLHFKDRGDKEATLTDLENQTYYPSDPAPQSYVAIVNGGVDVERLAEKGKLASLGPIGQPIVDFLRDRTPEFLRSLVSYQGQQYGVIVGLHRLNQFFYKTSITDQPEVAAALAAEGFDLRESPAFELNDLTVILKVLSEVSPEHSRPLLLADDAGALSTFVIENVMVAVAEKNRGFDPENGYTRFEDGYTQFWSGLSNPPASGVPKIDMGLFNEALEVVESLAQYIHLVPTGGTPKESIVNLLSGDETGAVFTVAGDWEAAALPPSIETRAFPGTDDVYVYTADAAVVPQMEETLTEQHPAISFLKVVTSVTAHDSYDDSKHSLGPVTSINGVTEAKTAVQMFKGFEPRAALPAYVPHLSFDDLEYKVGKYVKCLAELPGPPPSPDQDPCGRAALSKYVYDQYCEVVTGPDGECTRREPAGPRGQLR